MKIQEVIDEVNNTWGEEHEEKSRKIFWDNIIRKPTIIFIIITFLYLFAPFFYYLESISFRNLELRENAEFVGAIFNFPYRFLDLRTGIITSIASILLSLYVSVGKYAESLEGVAGDARRAAYRKFARRVGGFVFLYLLLIFGTVCFRAGCSEGTLVFIILWFLWTWTYLGMAICLYGFYCSLVGLRRHPQIC